MRVCREGGVGGKRGCRRTPLSDGLTDPHPPHQKHKTQSQPQTTGPGVNAHSLPEASTCDRRLSLPDYPSAAALKSKLLAAITHGCVGYDRV